MGEIGSEFWDVPVGEDNTRLFPESTQWFLSGRSALQAIVQELKNCKTVAMPSWCCDSMVKPFVNAGIEVQFYPIYIKESLVQDISYDCDALFLMDYFGYSTSIPNVNKYRGIVIRDVTHSIFSKEFSDARYYFGSLRKWCGVWTGGYSWSRHIEPFAMESGQNDSDYIALRRKAMQLKNCFIKKSIDNYGNRVTDKEYLTYFDEAEECLENVGVLPAADRDIMLAKKLDVNFIKKRRYENAEIIREAFPEWLIFPEMETTDCPMFVPIIVPNGRRDDLRQYLIQREIYCPIHWPVSKYHELDKREQFIYDNELSLICDQRYEKDDMERMIETIKSFWRGSDGTHSLYT